MEEPAAVDTIKRSLRNKMANLRAELVHQEAFLSKQHLSLHGRCSAPKTVFLSKQVQTIVAGRQNDRSYGAYTSLW